MALPEPEAPATKVQGLPPLVNELLEEIFLRLPTLADLARASVACSSFRQIITDRSFLRRFRALHPPPLLGFINRQGFQPAEPPYPTAPLASDLASAADFSYSFVPLPNGGPRWLPRDVRDGRVLLECCSFHHKGRDIPKNLAVCDPLFRRYVQLPRIPEGLTLQLQLQQDWRFAFASLLAPIGDDEDETSFKVIGIAQYTSKLVVFVFSSITCEWCIAASPTWSSLGTVDPSECANLSYFSYMHGSFYFAVHWENKLLVLDVCSMELSAIDIPAHSDSQMQSRGLPYIVMAGKGAFGLCTLVGNVTPRRPRASHKVYYTTRQNDGESSKQWQLERIIPLVGEYYFTATGAAEGLLFIDDTAIDDISGLLDLEPLPEYWDLDYFSLDVKTSELKKVCRTRLLYRNEVNHVNARPYFGFPPSLSKPSL